MVDVATAGAVAATQPVRRRRRIPYQAIIGTLPMIIVSFSVFFVAIIFSVLWSFTDSGMFPGFHFVGLTQYTRLWNTAVWQVAVNNIWFFGVMSLFVNLVGGFLLAVFMDQNIKQESLLRTIFLYPFAMSLVVTGLAWQWILDPNLGLQAAVRNWGWTNFNFAPLVHNETAIYGLVVAGIWQGAGVTMAIMLAGLRGVDQEVWKAAKIDGIPAWRTYLFIVLPMMRGALGTVLLLQLTGIARTFDLPYAMTSGGPGIATQMPAMYVISFITVRLNVGQGMAAATMLLLPVALILIVRAIVVWFQSRRKGPNS
jgi:glucose/mannose transport system permease protein